MLLRETVQHCARCDEVTPHSRRILAVSRLLGFAALAGAGWCFLSGAGWWLGGAALLVAAVLLLLRDRDALWSIACERCRWRELRALRKTRPTLDGNTEISFL